MKADILTWKQQIKSISTCSRQEAEKRGGGAPGSGTGRFNCIIMWNQSQTKAFIGTLNSHLAGCSTGCLRGCWAAWAAGPAGEEFSAAASSLDLQQRKNEGSDPTEQKQQQAATWYWWGWRQQQRDSAPHFLNLHPRVTKWHKHFRFTLVQITDYVISLMSWFKNS